MLDELLSKIRSYNPNSDVEKLQRLIILQKSVMKDNLEILGNLILFIQWLLLIF